MMMTVAIGQFVFLMVTALFQVKSALLWPRSDGRGWIEATRLIPTPNVFATTIRSSED